MSKTIHTPCTELVCGKLDLVGEELQHLGQFKSTQAAAIRLLDLAGDIQHDCERMEAKLIIRKDESEEAATKYAAVCQELEEAQREISDWETSMESVTGCDSIGEASNAILELKAKVLNLKNNNEALESDCGKLKDHIGFLESDVEHEIQRSEFYKGEFLCRKGNKVALEKFDEFKAKIKADAIREAVEATKYTTRTYEGLEFTMCEDCDLLDYADKLEAES